MKRFFVGILLAAGLALSTQAFAADLGANLCSVGTNSAAIKQLNLTPEQVAGLNATCAATAEKAAQVANEKLAPHTAAVAGVAPAAATVATPPTPAAAPSTDTSSFGKEFASGINTVVNGIAGAVVSTAHQLNITANDFIRSPAGIMVIAFIIAKFFGAAIIHFLVVIGFWLVITKFYIWAIKRAMEYTPTFESKNVLWGLFSYNKKISSTFTNFDSMKEGSSTVFVVSTIAYCVFTIVVICSLA